MKVIVLICTLLFGCATINNEVELAPPQYQTGSINSTYLYSNHVNEICSQKLGRLHNRHYFEACYVPGEDLIVLPKHWWPELKAHEEAHARGWRHAR